MISRKKRSAAKVYGAHLFLNPSRAKFLRGNKNMYFYFMSFLHIGMTQVIQILPQVKQELTYSI